MSIAIKSIPIKRIYVLHLLHQRKWVAKLNNSRKMHLSPRICLKACRRQLNEAMKGCKAAKTQEYCRAKVVKKVAKVSPLLFKADFVTHGVLFCFSRIQITDNEEHRLSRCDLDCQGCRGSDGWWWLKCEPQIVRGISIFQSCNRSVPGWPKL